MTIVTLPEGILIKRQTPGMNNYDLEHGNGDIGGSQVVVRAPPRMTCSLVSEELLDQEQAATWRALVLSLKGRVNHLAVYDLLNTEPRGTMRGVMVANGSHSAGSGTLSINAGAGQAFTTLKRGDWLGVNQAGSNRQVVHVQADATADASGIITVQVAANLRLALVNGASISWDKPTCLMRRTTSETSWNSEGAVQGGFSLDLIEDWYS